MYNFKTSFITFVTTQNSTFAEFYLTIFEDVSIKNVSENLHQFNSRQLLIVICDLNPLTSHVIWMTPFPRKMSTVQLKNMFDTKLCGTDKILHILVPSLWNWLKWYSTSEVKKPREYECNFIFANTQIYRFLISVVINFKSVDANIKWQLF